MKKNLLLAAAMLCGLAANAQEFAQFDYTQFGLTDLKIYTADNIAAGTVIGETASVTATVGAASTFQGVSVNGPKDESDLSYKYFNFNGSQQNTDDNGIQGNGNPKDANNGTPSSTFLPPTQGGSVFQFVPNQEGYLYVLHKASSNKSYTVFEEGSCLGYTFVMATDQTAVVENGTSVTLPQVLSYTLTGDAEYNYLSLDDYPNGILWPEKIWYGATGSEEWTWNNFGVSGLSVIKFKVYPDLNYIVNANGSKMSALGFYFDTTGDATVTITSDGGSSITLMENGDVVDAIQSVAVEGAAENTPAYNLAGQQVTDSYKGVVIKGGKKYINK